MITRVYVGVDISKYWFDVCMSLGEKAPVTRYSNDPQGHAKFVQEAIPLAEKVHVCMEYTGGCETALALACRAADMSVSLIDGGNFSTYRKSFGRAKAKTDMEDARLLARFASERKPVEWFPVPDEYRTLRELVRHRETLLRAKTAWGSRASAAQEALVATQRQTLREVIELQIKELDQEISDHIRAFPSLKEALCLITSIPGIGNVAGARIIAETGPISNYGSAKKYAMAAGLSPIVIHSGQKMPPGKLPVYGNAQLRCALYFPALVCKGHKVGVWKFMERVRNNGDKVKMTVITAGMRKLAHIIYGVLSTQTRFKEEMT